MGPAPFRIAGMPGQVGPQKGDFFIAAGCSMRSSTSKLLASKARSSQGWSVIGSITKNGRVSLATPVSGWPTTGLDGRQAKLPVGPARATNARTVEAIARRYRPSVLGG